MPNSLVNLSFVFSQPTGIATYATNLVPHLASLDPTLLIAPQTAQFIPNTANLPHYPIPNNLTPAQGSSGHLRRLLWTQLQVPRIYRQLKSSLFFSPVPEAPLYSQCRSVTMMHDLIPLRFPNRFSPLTPYYRYYIPQVLTQAEHIICNSQATATDIVDFYGIPARKITPIHLGYDRNHFRPLSRAENQSSKFLAEVGNSEESTKPFFLYIGRHDPYKNLQRLIAAFAAIPHCHNYQLWLAGSRDPRYTPQLKTQAEELGIAKQVKFLDYVDYDRLPIILSQATALVFPSLWEGFGIPVLEAMACGTPVITSNLASLPEVAGDAGILVNPYQVEAIAQAMEEIVTDQQLRCQLSRQSLQRAQQFSWQKTGQETVAVLSNYL